MGGEVSKVPKKCHLTYSYLTIQGRAYSRMRDIMLESLTPGEWVDKNPNDSPDPWVNSIFTLGRDCAKSNRKHRPEMEKVLLQLEKIQDSVAPQNNFQVRH